MQNQTQYIGNTFAHPRRAFFEGDGALLQGQGLCWNRDTGTAGDPVALRDWNVELPTTTNNMNFAGVVARAVPAQTGGQWIDIYEPGSTCLILVKTTDTVVNSTVLTCCAGGADVGYFIYEGLRGRGTALALQTVTVGTGSLVLAHLDAGVESGMVDAKVLTTGVNTLMVGGITQIPAVTLGSDATVALPDGTFIGEKLRIVLAGTITTSNLVVTPDTKGLLRVGVGAMTSLTFDTAGHAGELTWTGAAWDVTLVGGATEA